MGDNMYKISIPVHNASLKRSDREKIVRELKRFNTERVFLGMGSHDANIKYDFSFFEELKDNCSFFKKHGFEVGVWYCSFWVNNNTEFINMRSIKGKEIKKFMCPSDENYIKFASDFIKNIANCGFDLIQFEDDLRYGYLSDSPACLCDNHIKMINKITGENSTREELEKYILTGGKNKFRDAYLKANGDAFRSFASAMRSAVDEINPKIRIGFCSCMTSWDIDGTDAYELAKIFAGNTKPFVRLIGAPYWAVDKSWGNNLQDVIELERMESAWTKHPDIEIMAEGDVYPRPRTNCPASYLEGFDTAMRVSGAVDGIIKYGIDYTSHADYETGYAFFHERNIPVYKAIDEFFGNKKSCGVRVYESMKKISDMEMQTKVNNTDNIQDIFFSKAARSLAACSIPTVYEGDGICGIVFDENARNLPLSALKNGLILDIAAAEILTERGIDVGLENIGEVLGNSSTSLVGIMEEHFFDNDNYTSARESVLYDISIKNNAQVLSDILIDNNKIPLSYRYENANGNRFLVLNVNTRLDKSSMLKSYERSRQYAENIPWLSGKKLPAYIYGNPSLYMQCKKDKNETAVGLWNFFADEVINTKIELDKEYSSVEFINCKGELLGNILQISEMKPFSFAAFKVK